MAAELVEGGADRRVGLDERALQLGGELRAVELGEQRVDLGGRAPRLQVDDVELLLRAELGELAHGPDAMRRMLRPCDRPSGASRRPPPGVSSFRARRVVVSGRRVGFWARVGSDRAAAQPVRRPSMRWGAAGLTSWAAASRRRRRSRRRSAPGRREPGSTAGRSCRDGGELARRRARPPARPASQPSAATIAPGAEDVLDARAAASRRASARRRDQPDRSATRPAAAGGDRGRVAHAAGERPRRRRWAAAAHSVAPLGEGSASTVPGASPSSDDGRSDGPAPVPPPGRHRPVRAPPRRAASAAAPPVPAGAPRAPAADRDVHRRCRTTTRPR